MNELTIKMGLAGALFGAWPLIMNKSGLDGMSSAAVFTTVIALIVVPLALRAGFTTAGSNLWLAVAAGCAGAIGLLLFNDVLSKATPPTVSRLFIIMIIVQTAVPALYHVVMNGELTFKTGLGFAAAAVTAILLV
jgi:hypothetical protein